MVLKASDVFLQIKQSYIQPRQKSVCFSVFVSSLSFIVNLKKIAPDKCALYHFKKVKSVLVIISRLMNILSLFYNAGTQFVNIAYRWQS